KIADKQATLKIDFLIVGGDMAGLACAVALRRVGHRVTVLEQDNSDTLNKRRESSGPCRIAPNLSKILYHWGLKNELRSIAVEADQVNLLLYETGELLGTHYWGEEVLRDTQGEFAFTQHAALRHLLYELALFSGAVVRLGAKVSTVDPVNQTVTLAESGEKLQADVIIGADGPTGLTRRLLRPPVKEQLAAERMNMYSMTIPREAIMEDTDLAYLYSQKYTTMHNWFGHGRSALGFPVVRFFYGFGLFIYGPATDVEYDTQWDQHISPESLDSLLLTAEPKLKKLCRLSEEVICTGVWIQPELEDWVHQSGRMLVIGEAAHPLPSGSLQSTAMTIEDAAVLAKLFSHLRQRDQITTFLWAFQELRQPRCDSVTTKEAGIILCMTMEQSEVQQQRDDVTRAKRDMGKGILGGDGEDSPESPEWVEVKDVFGYSAEDEADNWWVQWGLLRERAKGTDVSYETLPIQVKTAVSH
ncbi:6-hydroxynicotinate 3-monooxygenase, partial [Termitomyces sp. J132]